MYLEHWRSEIRWHF